MTKPIPTIQKYMTTCPQFIQRGETLASAHKVMRSEGIRHLPVLDGDKLVGIVTERDLHLIETLRDVDVEQVKVEDAMTPHPYAVSPNAPLDEVVREMSDKKYGCAVIMQGKGVVGVFTTIDAMRALGELLRGRLAK